MPRKATSPESEDPAVDDNNNASGSGGEGDEDEEEYEIEEVLDARRGIFPDGRMGYFVKWKGYDKSHNSWVDENDAGNAKELVDTYWRKHPKKNRKSTDNAKKTQHQPETSDDDAHGATSQSQKKKRGRKSSTRDEDEDEEGHGGRGRDDMDVDEVPSKKKKKQSHLYSSASASANGGSGTGSGRKGAKGGAKSETPADDEDGEKTQVIKTMTQYMHVKSWEELVQTVDTVERDADDVLFIYFTLTTGESVRAENRICKQRFPQKLLDFYEDNLRWRSAQETD